MAEKRKIGDWIESGYLGHGTFGMVKLWHNEVCILKSNPTKSNILIIFLAFANLKSRLHQYSA